MLEQSEHEVQTWRIGLHEEGFASDKELDVQDTEHAEEILGRNTNTRHAEEAVDLSRGILYLVLKMCSKSEKNPGLSEKLEIQEVSGRFEVPKGVAKGQKSAELHAVVPIQAESSSNAASELSAHQMGAPAAAEVAQSSAESKNTPEENRTSERARPKGIRETKTKAKLETA